MTKDAKEFKKRILAITEEFPSPNCVKIMRKADNLIETDPSTANSEIKEVLLMANTIARIRQRKLLHSLCFK